MSAAAAAAAAAVMEEGRGEIERLITILPIFIARTWNPASRSPNIEYSLLPTPYFLLPTHCSLLTNHHLADKPLNVV